ncbi:MAG: MFS transporter [Candidatus Kariarchaeaceae archaeon]
MNPKESKGSFGLLFLAVLIDLLGFGIIIPILPFLIQDVDPDRSGVLLAMLLAVYSLAQFVSAPVWGRLSDRIGRRPVILVGLIGSSFGFALFGIVRSYALYLVARVIAGIFTGATLPTSRAYIADITPPQDRARRFGLLGAAFGIGFTFGPAIGSLLSLDIFLIPGLPTQAPAALFAAFLALVNFLLAVRRLPESLVIKGEIVVSPPLKTQLLDLSQIPQIPLLFVIFTLTTLIFSGFETILPLFANLVDNRINETNIGYFFAALGVLIAIFQSSAVGPTVNRIGEERTIIVAITLQALGFGLLAFASSIFLLGLVIIPLSFGTALLNPSVNAAISNRVPMNQQGSGLGVTSALGSLGRVIGPLFGGLLYDEISPGAPFLINAFLLIILFLAVFQPLTRGSVATQPAE